MATDVDDLFCQRCWHSKTITIDGREFPGACTCQPVTKETVAAVRNRHRFAVAVAKGIAHYPEPQRSPGRAPIGRLGGPPRSIKH